jgi:hypothetical protein
MMIATNEPRSPKHLRSEARMKVFLSGELRVRGGSASCRLLDISRGGACVEADGSGRVGDTVQFVRGQLIASGRIAWVRGCRIGVQFDAPIRATDLLVQMSHSRQAAAPPTRAKPLTTAIGGRW